MDQIQQYAMATFVLIGIVNGFAFAMDQDWKAFGKFLLVVVAGLLFGILGWFGLPSAEVGLAVGIGSSGVYKVAQKIGGV